MNLRIIKEPRASAALGAVSNHPLLLVGFGVILFSTGPVVVADTTASPPVLSFWRLLLGAAFMGVLTLWHVRASGRRPDRVGLSWTALCGLAFGLHQLCFVAAVKATSVVDVTLMQVLQPVFVGVLAALLFGEHAGARFRMWSLVAIAGAVVVVLGGATGPRGDPWGIALAVANVAFFALYFVWSKCARHHIDTVPFLFGVVLVALLFDTAVVAVTRAPVAGINGGDLAIALYIAVVPGALGHFVTIWPLKRIAANIPPVMQLAMPFLAGGLAWLLLSQPVTLLHVVGGVVTIAGVTGSLLTRDGRRLMAPGPDPTFVPGD